MGIYSKMYIEREMGRWTDREEHTNRRDGSATDWKNTGCCFSCVHSVPLIRLTGFAHCVTASLLVLIAAAAAVALPPGSRPRCCFDSAARQVKARSLLQLLLAASFGLAPTVAVLFFPAAVALAAASPAAAFPVAAAPVAACPAAAVAVVRLPASETHS